MPAKRWPVDRYSAAVAKLIEMFDVWPVVFGGPEDKPLGDRLLGDWNRGYNAAGALGLRSAAAALKRSQLYLGNDTGTMHLAAAVDAPCVAIFSAREWPGAWYPECRQRRILRSDVECEGCGLEDCTKEKNRCLQLITVDQVVAVSAEILHQRTELLRQPTWTKN
jgi:ADP-heptose:LPS heptosyltransferase